MYLFNLALLDKYCKLHHSVAKLVKYQLTFGTLLGYGSLYFELNINGTFNSWICLNLLIVSKLEKEREREVVLCFFIDVQIGTELY